jgi:hypothetical protein
MKAWANILVNGFVTILAVFIVIKLLVPNTPPIDVSKIQETLATQMKSVEVRLSAIEDDLSNQKLDRKLDMIIGKLSVLEREIGDIQLASALQRSSPPPMISGQLQMPGQMRRQNPMGWLENLSDEKRREVELIFEEHARRIRERLPAEPDGRLPDPVSMKKIMEESDWELREELKAVLTDEEYQSFLDSHPKTILMKGPSLPGSESEAFK